MESVSSAGQESGVTVHVGPWQAPGETGHELLVRAVRLSAVDIRQAPPLADVELRRAGLLRAPLGRHQYLAGRLVQRSFAAGLLQMPGALLELDYHCPVCGNGGWLDHGAPGYALDGRRAPVALSLSRCGDWAVVAGHAGAAAEDAVGVDVQDEASVAFTGFDSVALTARERRLVADTRLSQRPGVRARLWTRKEALLKALGVGLAQAPNSVDVITDPRVIDIEPGPLGLPPMFSVAVAQLRRPN